MSIGFNRGEEETAVARRTGNYSRSRSIFSRVTSGAFWHGIADRAIILVLILAGAGFTFALLTGKFSSANGVLGVSSRTGAKFHPILGNETTAVGDFLGDKPQYKRTQESSNDITVNRD